MPIETISFAGIKYPHFQSTGNASRFIMPFALEVCKGRGVDIGYNKPEWKMPGAIGVEPSIDSTFHAMNLPVGPFDYIFSSHMLEHYVGNWAEVLDYWTTRLNRDSVLFLYLPHPTQEYWLPFNNRKHIHSLSPELIKKYFDSCGWYKNIFISSYDLNNSFAVMAQKI